MSKVANFVKENFNLENIKEMVEYELEAAKEHNAEIDEEGVYLFDIVSGSYGQFQQEAIAEFFNIELGEDGIADEHEFIDDVSDYLTNHVGLKANIYFGYLDCDNSFGLFFSV